MKAWFRAAFILPILLISSVSRAGPILEEALQVIAITTTGDASFGTSPPSIGDIGASFSGAAGLGAAAVAYPFTTFGYVETADSSAGSWDVKFRINQYGLDEVQITLAVGDKIQLYTQLYADAAADASGSVSLNGASQVSWAYADSCNTTVLICGVDYEDGDDRYVVIPHPTFGQTIDISGALSANTSASAFGCPGIACSYAVAIGAAVGAFGITAISVPEPPILSIVGMALFLAALAYRRDRLVPPG